MIVKNNLLNFKNTYIYQDTEYFKMSLDSLLLVNFVTINLSDKNILDIATGNAPIPMLLTFRTKAKLYGVELQKEVFDLGMISIKENKMDEQITLINDDAKNLSNIFKSDFFDVITCNPPYFKLYEESRLNPNDKKALARHEIAMTLEDIFIQAKYLLRGKGKLYLVHRPERLSELIVAGKSRQLILKRLQFIYPKPGEPAKTVLLEFMKNGQDKGLIVLPPFYTQTVDDNYSEEARHIIYGQE